WTVMLSGDARAAESHARDALAIVEGLDDPGLLAEALTAVAVTEAVQGKGDPLAAFERALRVERPTEGIRFFRHPRLMFGIALKWWDRFDAARSMFESVRLEAMEQGDESSLPFVLSQLSELECWAGDWE